jgi:integrase
MLVTGMHRGETVGVRWEDVDLDGECLFAHVNRGLGKAAAEQIARALKPTGGAVPAASLQQSP